MGEFETTGAAGLDARAWGLDVGGATEVTMRGIDGTTTGGAADGDAVGALEPYVSPL